MFKGSTCRSFQEYSVNKLALNENENNLRTQVRQKIAIISIAL